jgi:hypothetical protein
VVTANVATDVSAIVVGTASVLGTACAVSVKGNILLYGTVFITLTGDGEARLGERDLPRCCKRDLVADGIQWLTFLGGGDLEVDGDGDGSGI